MYCTVLATNKNSLGNTSFLFVLVPLISNQNTNTYRIFHTLLVNVCVSSQEPSFYSSDLVYIYLNEIGERKDDDFVTDFDTSRCGGRQKGIRS